MKKFISIFMATVLSLSTMGIFASAAESDFKISDAVIVIAEDMSITDNYAANRLKYYLDEIKIGRAHV